MYTGTIEDIRVAPPTQQPARETPHPTQMPGSWPLVFLLFLVVIASVIWWFRIKKRY